MNNKYFFLVLIAIIIGGVFLINRQTSSGNVVSLPWYAQGSSAIKDAYSFAISNPEALNGVNCYCGCMQHLHDGRVHKRGLLDCFMKESGSPEKHASQCDMCINDALLVKQMTENGVDKETIKKTINAKYVR